MNGGHAIRLWRLAGLAALVMVVLSVRFASIPGIDACKAPGDPILAFELVASPAEADALFPPDCRAAELAAQRSALKLDNYAFAPAYGLFLVLALYAQLGERSRRSRRTIHVLVAAVVVVMLADWLENSRLALLADSFPGSAALIGELYPVVRVKFVLMGLVLALIGALHVRAGGLRRVAGAIIAAAGAWTAAATVVAPHGLTLPNSIAWGTLVVLSAVLAVRPPRPIASA